MKRRIFVLLAAISALAVFAATALATNTVYYTGQGFDDGKLESVKCGAAQDLGLDSEFEVGEDGGYLKWVLTAAGATSATITGPWGTFDMIPAAAGAFQKATDYYPLEELLAFPVRATYQGSVVGNVQLVVSNGCPGEDVEFLDVSKTAVTSFIREHFWDIAKKVETENGYELEDGTPKIWLYTDASGDETATWTIDVTYEGFEDGDFNVSGTITIENTGTLDAFITDIKDLLDGTEVDVACGEDFEPPYLLKVGETLTCTYDEDVDSKIEGFNEVTVTTERDTYFADAEIVWGDPDEEINKTVTVKDLSDLFDEVDLGTVTAPNGDTFTYDKVFAWAGYGQDGCGSYQYDNTATIVETEQSASATLKVNVQCFIFESAWAKGTTDTLKVESFCDNGFANWGWTNKIGSGYTGAWPLWAGAAQCDTSKGTLVGSVNVTYDADTKVVTVEFVVDPEYLLGTTAVYADYGKFPKLRNGQSTTAPGRYYNASPFNGNPVWVIAHANVGIPDPDFGP